MGNETWSVIASDVNLRSLVQEVAVHASSLWDGFVFQRNSEELFYIWGQGGIELHFQMANLAIVDAQLCDALFTASETSFPGVYTYEVTEALGAMVGAHLVSTGNFPTEAEWQTALGELALAFFERGRFGAQEIAVLREVVVRQLPHWQAASDENPPPTSITNIQPAPVGGNHSATA